MNGKVTKPTNEATNMSLSHWKTATPSGIWPRYLLGFCALAVVLGLCGPVMSQEKPIKSNALLVDLGKGTTLEMMAIPAGKFMEGSTPAERAWATGIEGGATPGTVRESYEGEARGMQVKDDFWLGRTEVSVGQFRRFVEDSGYISDAEKPGGHTQCFYPEWNGYHLTTTVVHPWKPMPGKSWRDPNFGFPLIDNFPVVCVSWQDGQ